MKPSCSSSVKIHRRYEGREQEWNQFLDGCPSANFYQRVEWLRINRDALGHDVFGLVAEDAGAIVGVFPLVRVRSRLFGDILSSMPFVNFGGPAASSQAVEAELVAAARELADELGCDYLEVRAVRPMCDWPTSTRKVSMTVPLLEDPEELLSSYSSKHRHNVRRSLKNTVEVKRGGIDLVDDFFLLMQVAWRRLGTPLYGKRFFQRIIEILEQDIDLYVAYADEQPVSAAFNGRFSGVVEGMWSASSPLGYSTGATYALLWNMIADACESGLQRYHLGRCTQGSAAEGFKAKWGAEPKQLYWSYHLRSGSEMPGLNPDNPRYQLAIRTWQKLPLPLLRVLGPRVARLIP